MLKAITLLICLVSAYGLPVPVTQQYSQSLQLDTKGNYLVYWEFNDTHITFEVHVKTFGYVGFGLSPNGNMYPADIVIGGVMPDGRVYFKDRHTNATTRHAPPVIDKSQDWVLLHGEENEFGTILKFSRKLETCDNDDLTIDDQTIRLIYSYHELDPTSETSPPYHGAEHRGTKSVSLLSSSLPSPVFQQDDLKIYEFRTRNYVVPDKETTYLCTGFQMPDLGGKHHMTEFEPIFTPGMEPFLHHLVVMRCDGRHPDLNMKTAECFWDWPKDWPSCSETFAAWGAGGGPYYFPDNAAYAIGDEDDSGFYVMQTHYNNPGHKHGMIDSSGVRIKLTQQLRQNDVTGLALSHSVNFRQVIPPQETDFTSRGYCSSQCTSKALEQGPEIHVIAGLQHAHLLGVGMTTRHFRNGTEIEPLFDDPNYDYYFQEMRPLKRERLIKPGDSFITECNYNSMQRSGVSFGGLSTREEMCITFLYVYPKTAFRACSSLPIFDTYHNVTGDALRQMFETMNWQDQTVKADFKKKLEDSKHSHHCVRRENGKTTVDREEFVEQQSPFNRAQFSTRQCPVTSP